MAVITATGQTKYGKANIKIIGNSTVKDIVCDDEALKAFVAEGIRKGDGWLANGYHPPGWSMLQAFAFLTNIFYNYYDVIVDGDIGEIPTSDDPDMIY